MKYLIDGQFHVSAPAVVETQWRGVPPYRADAERFFDVLPTWSSRHFSREQVETFLVKCFGDDWTLQERFISESDWEDVE